MTDHAPKLTIAEVMIQPVHRLTPEMTVQKAIEILIRYAISGAPIVDQNDVLLSVVSEGDMLRLAASEGFEATLAHCLTHLKPAKAMITVEKHHSFADAYRLILKHSLHRLVVVDSAMKLQGLVTRSDILRLLIEARYGKKLPPRKN